VEKIASALKGAEGCNVNIMTPETPEAQATARRLLDIFGECGFAGKIIRAATSAASSFELQSNCRNAAAALAVQTAFHDGGFCAPLLINDAAPIDAVLICLGKHGLG
jgi:hypothetical protein